MLSKYLFRNTKPPFMKQFEKNSTFKFSINSAFKKIAVLVFSLTILSSLVSYTLVLGKEKELSKLHTITHNIQMDNVDIRNDVEFTRSLYNVHYQSKSLSYLKKPDKIIEIDLDKQDLRVKIDKCLSYADYRIVTGY